MAASVTALGIFSIRHFEDWSRANSTYFCSFAVGTLITVSFIHLLPESLNMYPGAPVLLLAGYLFMHLFTRFISGYLCDRFPDNLYAFGLVPMLGIGFHSFLDGFIYAVTFSISTFTGILAAIGLVLHEFPEGIVTYVFLRKGGFDRGKASSFAFLAAGLSTPAGALASYPFVTSIKAEHLGAMLALSCGILIYVGATHLLPQAEREEKRFSTIALFLGVLLAAAIVYSHH